MMIGGVVEGSSCAWSHYKDKTRQGRVLVDDEDPSFTGFKALIREE
jgi:hypothetical protein